MKPNTNELIQNEIIEFALKQLNKPYEHCYRGPNSFDCAGLVWYIYKKLYNIDIFERGIGLSTTTKIMTSPIGKLTLLEDNKLDNLSKGDIILLHRQSLKDNTPLPNNKYPGHCGIYLGNEEFIHCPGRSTSARKVIISKVSPYWYKRLVASKNYIEDIKVKTLCKS